MTTAATTPATRASRKKAPATATPDRMSQLTDQLKELRLPTIRDLFQESAVRAETENLSHLDYPSELTTRECEARREGRIKRLMTRSKLHPGKTWDNFKFNRLPLHVVRQLETLRDGSFLDRRENVLLFGKPGSGKSHALCALSEQLILQGRSLLFTTCSLLVQQLLVAKRDLRLPKMIKQLSSFEGLIIDDLGYVQQSREPRYCARRGSVVHTSGGTLRTRQRSSDEQSGLQQVGPDFQGRDDHSRRDRPAGPPQRDHRNERAELPCGSGEEHQNEAFTVTDFKEPDRNSNCR